MPQQILRITFTSGIVAEKIGDDETVVALYDADHDDLIDHILSIEVDSGECSIFTREDDDRFDDLDLFVPRFPDFQS